MKRSVLVSASVAFAAAAAVAVAVLTIPRTRAGAAGPIAYVPISSSVFIGRGTAAQIARTHNEFAARVHALALWNGLAAATNESFRGVRLAVFDTWYTPCDVYPPANNCGHGIVHQPTIMDLEPPEQFFHLPRISATDILSGVRYNAEMKAFVDAGYGGAPYTTGAGLIKAMKAGLTDLPDQAAPTSMMLKPTYELLSRTKPTVITYWAGPGLTVRLGASTSPLVPDATTWMKVALVDPTGKANNSKPVTFCANTIDPAGDIVGAATYTAPAGSYIVVPLSDFYAIPVTKAEISIVEQNRFAMQRRQYESLVRRLGAAAARTKVGCPNLTPADPVAALVGMHVVSAELKDVWTWQTFWWNPTTKPLLGARKGFQYFDFATAYWTVDRKPYGWRYAFNPYLEAGFGTEVFSTPYWPPAGQPGSAINVGRTTNCISCHSQATYTIPATPSPSPAYVAHDSQPQLDLPQSIKTRNLWSLAIRAGHPNP
jgi:hypothetical protein